MSEGSWEKQEMEEIEFKKMEDGSGWAETTRDPKMGFSRIT